MECAYAHTWILIMEEWRLRQWNNFQSRPCFGGGCSTCRSKQGQTPAQTHACICLQLSFSSNSSFLCESALDYEYLIPGYSSTMVLGAGYIVHNITGMYCVIMITNVLLPLLFGYSSTRVPLCIVLCTASRKENNLRICNSRKERARAGKGQGDRERKGGSWGGRFREATGMHSWPHGDTMVARSAVALPCQYRHAIASDARACQCTVLRVTACEAV